MMMELDDLSVSPSTIPPECHGAFRLWLRVFRDCLIILKDGGFPGQVDRSRSFIFDPENEFFEYVAMGLGVDPAGLRSRVKKAIRGEGES